MSLTGCFGILEAKSDKLAARESSKSSSMENSSKQKMWENHKLEKVHKITQINHQIHGQITILKDGQHGRGQQFSQQHFLNGNVRNNGSINRIRDSQNILLLNTARNNPSKESIQINNYKNIEVNNRKLNNVFENIVDNEIIIDQNNKQNESRFVKTSQQASNKEENKNILKDTKYNSFSSSYFNQTLLSKDNPENKLNLHVSQIPQSQKLASNLSTDKTTTPTFNQSELRQQHSQNQSDNLQPSTSLSYQKSNPYDYPKHFSQFNLHQGSYIPIQTQPLTIIYINNVSINTKPTSKEPTSFFSQTPHIPKYSFQSEQTQPTQIVNSNGISKQNHPNNSLLNHMTNSSFQDQLRTLTTIPVSFFRKVQTQSCKCNDQTDGLSFYQDDKLCKSHRIQPNIAETEQKLNSQANKNNANIQKMPNEQGQHKELSGGSLTIISQSEEKLENHQFQSQKTQPERGQISNCQKYDSQNSQLLQTSNKKGTQVKVNYYSRCDKSIQVSDNLLPPLKKDSLNNREFHKGHNNGSASQNTAQFIDDPNLLQTNFNDNQYFGNNERSQQINSKPFKVQQTHQHPLEVYSNKSNQTQKEAKQFNFLDSSCSLAYEESSQERKQDLCMDGVGYESKHKEQKLELESDLAENGTQLILTNRTSHLSDKILDSTRKIELERCKTQQQNNLNTRKTDVDENKNIKQAFDKINDQLNDSEINPSILTDRSNRRDYKEVKQQDTEQSVLIKQNCITGQNSVIQTASKTQRKSNKNPSDIFINLNYFNPLPSQLKNGSFSSNSSKI